MTEHKQLSWAHKRLSALVMQYEDVVERKIEIPIETSAASKSEVALDNVLTEIRYILNILET